MLIVGQKYKNKVLTAIFGSVYLFKCDKCNSETTYSISKVKSVDDITSCWECKKIDLFIPIGTRIGKRVLLGKNPNGTYQFKCDCGHESSVSAHYVKHNKVPHTCTICRGYSLGFKINEKKANWLKFSEMKPSRADYVIILDKQVYDSHKQYIFLGANIELTNNYIQGKDLDTLYWTKIPFPPKFD